SSFLFLSCLCLHHDRHSFPTRRSSDLTKLEVDLDSVIPDWSKTLKEHAIAAWEPISSQYYPQLLKSVCNHYGIDMNIPVKAIPKDRKSTRLNSSHVSISYAVFCLKKKK